MCTAASGRRCFSLHASDWLETGHDTAGRPSVLGPCDYMAHCTRTTPATPAGLTAARLLHTRVQTLSRSWPGRVKTPGWLNRISVPGETSRHRAHIKERHSSSHDIMSGGSTCCRPGSLCLVALFSSTGRPR